MADVTKININNSLYDLKDALARNPYFTIPTERSLPVSQEEIGVQMGKIVKYLTDMGDLAFKESLSQQDIYNSLGYIPLRKDTYDADMNRMNTKYNIGINAVYDEIVGKGVTPASKSVTDICQAISDISTGGTYMTKEISEDGIYYATDDGVDGYNIVVVSKDVGQPHTVIFYGRDGSTILKTQANVPYHGNASCTLLDGDIYNGLYFKGWNPSPINVTRDLECYPQYGDYTIESTDIQDDWETICSNCGAPYPLGAKKTLSLNGLTIPSATFKAQWYGEYRDVTYPAKSCTFAQRMVKVAEGEDGSTSTWLSEYSFTVVNGDGGDTWRDWTWYGNNRAHWSNSGIRGWLNNAVIQILPQCLQDTIKQVNKISRIYNGAYMDQETLDKIWIPSMRELYTTYDSTERGKPSANAIETQGINYELAYRRNFWNGYYLTRTENGGESAPVGSFYWNSGTLCYSSRNVDAFISQSNYGGYQIGFCL